MSAALDEYLLNAVTDHCPVWVDAWSYGEALLNKGETAPWGDVAAFVSFHRQLQSLVRSDVLLVEVGRFYEFWVQRDPALLAAMGQKRRVGYPLRTLLANPDARSAIHEIVNAICDSYTDKPVVLALPSPKSWLGSAYKNASKTAEVRVSWDDAESASMYVADFLRVFSDCNIAGILLREDEGDGPASEEELLRYQPLLNVAQHYGWQLAFDGCTNDFLATPAQGIDICMGEQTSRAQGKKLGSDYWDGETPVPSTDKAFWYCEVPPQAVPEKVLEKLAALRKAPGA